MSSGFFCRPPVTTSSFTGTPAVRNVSMISRVPYAVAWCSALCMEGFARLTGGVPQVPLTAVRMARKAMYFSAAKAVGELGLPQTPVETALRDAVEWFAAHGYVIIPRALADTA